MTSPLHDILQGLVHSRVRVEALADEIEHVDPAAATVLREFAEDLWDVWIKYYPELSTHKDLALIQDRPKYGSPPPTPQRSKGQS